MRNCLLVFPLFLSSFTLVFSQSVNYVKTWGGIGAITNHSSTFTDSLGNSFSVGSFTGTIDIDPGVAVKSLTSSGLTDIYIVKLDPLGNHVWSHKFGGKKQEVSNGVITDRWGNIYVTGWFTDSLYIGSHLLKSKSSKESYLYKLNKNGEVIWAYNIAIVDSSISSNSISKTQNGNFILTGNFIYKSALPIYFLDKNGRKTDSIIGPFTNAGGLFIKQFDTSGTGKLIDFLYITSNYGFISGKFALQDQSSNTYSCGTFNDHISFDPGNGFKVETSKGLTDIFLRKYRSSKGFLWGKTLGGIGSDTAYSIVLDEKDNIYITGSFENIVNFDEGFSNLTLTASGMSDVFVVKYDSSGRFKWVTQIGGTKNDVGKELIYQKEKGIFLSGHFSESIQIVLNGINRTFTSTGLHSGFISAIDSTGKIEWFHAHNGLGKSTINTIEYVPTNSFILSGQYSNSIDFGFGFSPNSNWAYTSNGSSDSFVEKISLPGIILDTYNVTKDELIENIYPNPAKVFGKITIPQLEPNAKITIYDAMGNHKLEFSNLRSPDELEIGGVNPGVYFLEVILKDKIQTTKIIIE